MKTEAKVGVPYFWALCNLCSGRSLACRYEMVCAKLKATGGEGRGEGRGMRMRRGVERVRRKEAQRSMSSAQMMKKCDAGKIPPEVGWCSPRL